MAPVRDLTPGSDGSDSGASEIRERRPEGGAWRADALAGSRHRRLLDEIPRPQDDFDPERSAALCAEICRELLRDFAPGLALLPPAERRRLQALAAYTRTLFDFARQRGLEGERLAQINRWEFTLETALSGQAVGQPVFVAMARCEQERPWPRVALDELAAAARRGVTLDEQHPWSAAHDRRLARALLDALLGEGTASTADEATVAEALALRRRVENPAAGTSACAAPRQVGEAAGDYARFLRFVGLATAALQRRARSATAGSEARLGVWTRLALLVRARLGGRR